VNNNQRMKIRVASFWDKSIALSPLGLRSSGSEMTEVDAPTPELPWEMEGIKGIAESLGNIHIATRTHEAAHLAQVAVSLITAPAPGRRKVPVEAYQ
jgi:hypothetical protein